jgi:hypothetical protein
MSGCGILNGHGGPVLATPKPPLTPVLVLVGADAVAKSKPIPTFTPEQIEYFWSRMDRSGGPTACWPWLGSTDRDGYGVVKFDRKQYRTHRIAYFLTFGEIPLELTLDHVRDRGCTLKSCGNPYHLEPVPAGENTLRGDAVSAINRRKTHCIRGHELSGDNLGVRHNKWGTKRYCRTCRLDRQRARQSSDDGRERSRTHGRNYRDRHPDRARESARAYQLKIRSQESPEEYEARRDRERAYEAAYRERKRAAKQEVR